jgi:hypothetical protein
MEDHGELGEKIDDYLWFKLCQTQIEADDTADILTLNKLQTILFEDYGNRILFIFSVL